MRGRRALICSYYAPSIDGDSGARRVLDHMEFLRSDGWAVDFYAANGVNDEVAARRLRARGVGVYDDACVDFDALVGTGAFDLALFAFWQPAEHLMPSVRALSPETRIIVDSVDLQFLRDARRVLGPQPGPGHRRLLGPEYGNEFVGELNVYAAADGVLTVSEKEAALIEDLLLLNGHATPVPDNEELEPSPLPFGKRRGIVFVGSFQHPPNAGAVRYLCQEIVPRLDPKLLRKHPISVIGTGLDDTVRSYADDLVDVCMVGWVPSVVPYLAQARISVVPLLYGAGTKRKLLQSLMLGTPAVSTTIGAEGIDLVEREDVLIADDPARFAEAIAELLTDRVLWRQIARSGRRKVIRAHARGVVQARFGSAVAAVMARHPRPALLPPSSAGQYHRRMVYLQDQKLVRNAARALDAVSHPEAPVAVVTNGSIELLRLGVREATHFPSDDGGGHSGSPSSADEAISELEKIRAAGVEHLLIPSTASWWLEHYRPFAEHLASTCSLVFENEVVGRIYRLRPDVRPPENGTGPPRDTSRFIEPDVAEEPPVPAVRLIAFYLPQFHPIPENDAWWGEGFTEWSNVAAAEPLFEGHYQPHIPADLGFYDLRLSETRIAQAELARRYGISGFCYYHYWFSGNRLLDRPFDEVLRSGEPDFPFCLCWANEPWSRRWHGRDEDVLQPQTYSHADDLEHIRSLLGALADPRAIRVDGKAVFVVYQARDLPDPARTVEIWRDEIDRAGLPGVYLMAVETGWDEAWDATEVGFDAKVMFRPQFTTLGRLPALQTNAGSEIKVYDYAAAARAFSQPDDVDYPHYETVCPRWDNSPRTGTRGVVLHGATPEAYEHWLTDAVKRATLRPPEHQLVFINAWNEWGEGCHLEPDLEFGHAFLEATRRALDSAGRVSSNGRPDSVIVAQTPPKVQGRIDE
jgi:glycosyltransferase involved in cell wall biosynthesis